GSVVCSCLQLSPTGTRLFFWSTRDLADHSAGLGIIFLDRLIADVDETFAVHCHAVAFGRIERADHVSAFVEMDHGWRPGTAFSNRWVRFSTQIKVRQVVWPIQYPDVVVLIHSQSRDASHLPLFGQWLGPVRVELILWRVRRLRSHDLKDREEAENAQQTECT